jgi:hypothetical protein
VANKKGIKIKCPKEFQGKVKSKTERKKHKEREQAAKYDTDLGYNLYCRAAFPAKGVQSFKKSTWHTQSLSLSLSLFLSLSLSLSHTHTHTHIHLHMEGTVKKKKHTLSK